MKNITIIEGFFATLWVAFMGTGVFVVYKLIQVANHYLAS